MEPYKIRYIYTPIGTRMFPLVSDARLYTYLSLLILAHCTHTHTAFSLTEEMYIVERSLVELYRLKPLQTVASFGCLSSYRKFRNAVSGYRSPDTASTSSLMDRINHGDIQASRRGNGEDFAINAKSLFSFPRFAFSRLLTRYIREQILFSFVNNI